MESSSGHRRVSRGAGYTLLVAISCWVGTPGGARADTPAGVRIDVPSEAAQVSAATHLAEIRGVAVAGAEAPPGYDLMIAVDVSKSTDDPSGSDVDGDGVVGMDPRRELVAPGTYPEGTISTDPDDSVLAAEVLAAGSLIAGLDASRVRVGLLVFSSGFSGASGGGDARLDVPLTSDFGRVSAALEALRREGGHGATNFAAGIQLGVRELSGLPGAESEVLPERKRVLIFLTDGKPSYPVGRADVVDPGDIEAAIRAANLARAGGVPIHVYAIGLAALTEPVAATEIARVSLGRYTPVRNPADLVPLLQSATISDIEDVVLTNLSTGDFSTDVRLSPDGSFTGLVPVRVGENRVRVTALSSAGERSSAERSFVFAVEELRGRELERELERIRRRNTELMRLIERQRIEAFRERERQRKELEILPEVR